MPSESRVFKLRKCHVLPRLQHTSVILSTIVLQFVNMVILVTMVILVAMVILVLVGLVVFWLEGLGALVHSRSLLGKGKHVLEDTKKGTKALDDWKKH